MDALVRAGNFEPKAVHRIWRKIGARPTSMVYSAWRAEKERLMQFLLGPGHYAIEIGSFAGSTSRALGVACEFLDKQLICIDPWEGENGEEQYGQYLQAIADIRGSVTTIRARSCAARSLLPEDAHGNVCLLFIDGDHTYPGPLYDMRFYWPLLAEGGAMAIHDIFDVWWYGGILKSLTEFFVDKPGYCLEAMNFIPTSKQARDAKHGSSGLIWAFKEHTSPDQKLRSQFWTRRSTRKSILEAL